MLPVTKYAVKRGIDGYAKAAFRQAIANPRGAYGAAKAAWSTGKAAYGGIKDAVGYARRFVRGPSKPSTASQKVRSGNKQTWGPGRSGGKFRINRKPRLRRQRKALKKGVEQVRENVGTVQGLYSCYIGQASQPINMMKELLWYAIAKRIAMILTRNSMTAVDEAIPQLAVGKIVTLLYRTNPAAAVASTTYTVAGSTATIRALAAGLSLAWETLTPTDQFQLVEIYSTNVDTPFNLNLINSKLQYYAKSTMKIQNRSAGAGGNEDDDVDNVPLYGKSYQCRGNGTVYLGNSASTVGNGGHVIMQANNTTGIYTLAVDTAVDLAEPPSPIPLMGVRKYDKVKLEPGEIKTSTLQESYTISLQKLINMFGTVNAFNPTWKGFGHYRMFGLEKIMETAEPPTVYIKLGFEHQIRMSCHLITASPTTRTMFVAYQQP